MIIKSYEFNKIDLSKKKFLLVYGNNEGAKKEIISKLLTEKRYKNINQYEEKEILENENILLESILSKSLFENERVIIIKRVTEKLFKFSEELINKDVEDIIIILNSSNLDKKSKLRSLFEKNKDCMCVPFYPDNEQTLSKLAFLFLKEKKISISPANINLIINKCNGDREKLFNELDKIENFSKGKKKITTENIVKLINLDENHSVANLIDNCLAKNKKKIINILNENNFSNEDCVIITRTFLNKSKKILKLTKSFEENKNIELTISSAKPPIFWKDKEIVKQQIYKWKPKKLNELIYNLSELELNIKKNLNNSVNLITDFVLEQASSNN